MNASSAVTADLERIAAVPAVSRRRSSSLRIADVLRMTGIPFVALSDFSRSWTSNPVISDMTRSRKITSGRSSRARRSPSSPLAAAQDQDRYVPRGRLPFDLGEQGPAGLGLQENVQKYCQRADSSQDAACLANGSREEHLERGSLQIFLIEQQVNGRSE